MKLKLIPFACVGMLLLSGPAFVSCDNDDDDDGVFQTRTITVENVTATKNYVQSGTFAGTAQSGAIAPGQQVQVKFHAGKGQTLHLAAMYANSKDLFFASENPGIMLFNTNGTPVTGDVSAQVKLWDNGTVVNSDPALPVGGQTTGTEDRNITEVAGTDGTYIYPAANDMMKLTLAFNASTSEFTLTIRNNSDQTQVATSFSPGVWAVSNMLNGEVMESRPFYTVGQKTTSELTALATAGNNEPFVNLLNGSTGIMTTITPVLVVVYSGSTNPIFQVNQKDGGQGLAKLAQTGDASELKSSLERERLVRKVYVFGTNPAAPGARIEGQYEAFDYEKIAFVTGFGYSNDWFFANNSEIGAHSTGDKSNQVSLYDNGTAVSQYPGAGNGQFGFTNAPVTEDQVIRVVDETTFPDFPVPAVNKMVKVTIH